MTDHGPGTSRIRRLSAYDRHCLRVETAERPGQIGVLAILDGWPAGEADEAGGRPGLADVRRSVEARLGRVPEFRRVVYRPGPPAGGPLWVDDPAFDIERHVDEVAVAPPADEAALFALVDRLVARPLDRSRPLWRAWFVTGLEAGRVGMLFVLHHAFADGLTAMRMVRSLLGPPMSPAGPDPGEVPVTTVRPARSELVLDNIRSALGAMLRLMRPATWRLFADVIRSAARSYAHARRAPRTSLNGPVGPRRALATVRLDLATVKRVARGHACGANDVVLALAAAGVRALLEARGEPIEGLRPLAAVAVALFSPGRGGETGNDVGTIMVPLELGGSDPGDRLRRIATASAVARRDPTVAMEPLVRAWLSRFGLVRRAMAGQHHVNLAETYLPGPPVPIEILGVPVRDLLPIAALSGNLGLSFVAFSYAGRLTVAVRADADRFPDLSVLAAAMERECAALAGPVAPVGP